MSKCYLCLINKKLRRTSSSTKSSKKRDTRTRCVSTVEGHMTTCKTQVSEKSKIERSKNGSQFRMICNSQN